MGDFRKPCGAAAEALLRERDYDGTRVLRGFGNGFSLAGISWIAIASVVSIAIAFWPIRAETFGSGAQLTSEARADCGDVPLPPQEYDHAAAIPLLIRQVPFGQVDHLCHDHNAAALITTITFDRRATSAVLHPSSIAPADFEAKACSWTYAKLGFVILPKAGEGGVTDAWDACALRHETGHINGWPASHPNAHYESR